MISAIALIDMRLEKFKYRGCPGSATSRWATQGRVRGELGYLGYLGYPAATSGDDFLGYSRLL